MNKQDTIIISLISEMGNEGSEWVQLHTIHMHRCKSSNPGNLTSDSWFSLLGYCWRHSHYLGTSFGCREDDFNLKPSFEAESGKHHLVAEEDRYQRTLLVKHKFSWQYVD